MVKDFLSQSSGLMYITPVNNYLKMAVRIQESSIHVPNFFPQILLKEEQAVRKLGI